MNKIPKCKSKNTISRQNLKLIKKYTGENNIIKNHYSKNIKHFGSYKQVRKEIVNSIIKSLKPSTITTASSKKNSIFSKKNVIYIYLNIFLFIYFYIS